MTEPRFDPLELRAPRGATTVEILWADGHTSTTPNATLRGYCPCAACQGHSGSIRFIPDQNDTIETIDEIGTYGISFGWGDGHSGGIYTFRYLRSLCVCSTCQPTGQLARTLPRND